MLPLSFAHSAWIQDKFLSFFSVGTVIEKQIRNENQPQSSAFSKCADLLHLLGSNSSRSNQAIVSGLDQVVRIVWCKLMKGGKGGRIGWRATCGLCCH
jgi:hypothetical protein